MSLKIRRSTAPLKDVEVPLHAGHDRPSIKFVPVRGCNTAWIDVTYLDGEVKQFAHIKPASLRDLRAALDAVLDDLDEEDSS